MSFRDIDPNQIGTWSLDVADVVITSQSAAQMRIMVSRIRSRCQDIEILVRDIIAVAKGERRHLSYGDSTAMVYQRNAEIIEAAITLVQYLPSLPVRLLFIPTPEKELERPKPPRIQSPSTATTGASWTFSTNDYIMKTYKVRGQDR